LTPGGKADNLTTMGKKKDEEQELQLVELTPQERALENIRARIADLSGDGTAVVYILRGEEPFRRGKLSLRTLLDDPDLIGKKYGGGSYIVDFRDPTGALFSDCQRSVPFNFDPLTYGPEKDLTKPAGQSGSSAPSADGMAERMLVQLEAVRTEAAARDREHAQRQHELMLEMIRSSKQPASASPAEILALAQQIAGRQSTGMDAAGVAAIVGDIVDKVKGAGDEDTLSMAVREGIKMLTEMAGREKPAAGRALAGPGNAPANPPAGGNQVGKGNGSGKIFEWIYKAVVPQLVRAAAAGKQAADIANELMERFDGPEGEAALYELVTRADLFDYLAGFDAGVRSHVPWFTALRDAILATYKDEGEGAAEPEEVATP